MSGNVVDGSKQLYGTKTKQRQLKITRELEGATAFTNVISKKMFQCIVCQELTNKYKCPKCSGPYCSMNCYRHHKDSAECSDKQTIGITSDDVSKEDYMEEPTIHEPFKTEDTVAKEKLKQLGNSEHLKNLLYNPHLRNLLTQIDTAPSAWKAIQAAMQEPLFLEFANECLAIVEPETEDD